MKAIRLQMLVIGVLAAQPAFAAETLVVEQDPQAFMVRTHKGTQSFFVSGLVEVLHLSSTHAELLANRGVPGRVGDQPVRFDFHEAQADANSAEPLQLSRRVDVLDAQGELLLDFDLALALDLVGLGSETPVRVVRAEITKVDGQALPRPTRIAMKAAPIAWRAPRSTVHWRRSGHRLIGRVELHPTLSPEHFGEKTPVGIDAKGSGEAHLVHPSEMSWSRTDEGWALDLVAELPALADLATVRLGNENSPYSIQAAAVVIDVPAQHASR